MTEQDYKLHRSNIIEHMRFVHRCGVQLNKYVPNTHIIKVFELFLELLEYAYKYQTEFNTSRESLAISYINNAFSDVFDNGEVLSETIVHDTYQKLRRKDDHLRNTEKLVMIVLQDLLMPLRVKRNRGAIIEDICTMD